MHRAQNSQRGETNAAGSGVHEHVFVRDYTSSLAHGELNRHVHGRKRTRIFEGEVGRDGRYGIRDGIGECAETANRETKHAITDNRGPVAPSLAIKGRNHTGKVTPRSTGIARIHAKHIQHVPEVHTNASNENANLTCAMHIGDRDLGRMQALERSTRVRHETHPSIRIMCRTRSHKLRDTDTARRYASAEGRHVCARKHASRALPWTRNNARHVHRAPNHMRMLSNNGSKHAVQ